LIFIDKKLNFYGKKTRRKTRNPPIESQNGAKMPENASENPRNGEIASKSAENGSKSAEIASISVEITSKPAENTSKLVEISSKSAENTSKVAENPEFRCFRCDLVLSTAAGLRNHVKIRHFPTQNRFFCAKITCLKGFKTGKMFEKHAKSCPKIESVGGFFIVYFEFFAVKLAFFEVNWFFKKLEFFFAMKMAFFR
jgi:hypothetical protein